jgi:hypothetical protein
MRWGEGGWLPYDFMISERAHTYDGALKRPVVHCAYSLSREKRARNETGLFQHYILCPIQSSQSYY